VCLCVLAGVRAWEKKHVVPCWRFDLRLTGPVFLCKLGGEWYCLTFVLAGGDLALPKVLHGICKSYVFF